MRGVVVLNTAAKADFVEFRGAGFAAYLVRPVRPRSLLTQLGAGSAHSSDTRRSRQSRGRAELASRPTPGLGGGR